MPDDRSDPGTRTIVLIRHADVPAPGSGSDPSLSRAGGARAKVLRRVLSQAGVGAIFVTQFKRTRQTAAPLAVALGIAPTVIDQDDADLTVAAIMNLPGSPTALVVGHTTTLPIIIAGLGGSPIPPIGATEFDHLFVQMGDRVAHLRYGA